MFARQRGERLDDNGELTLRLIVFAQVFVRQRGERRNDGGGVGEAQSQRIHPQSAPTNGADHEARPPRLGRGHASRREDAPGRGYKVGAVVGGLRAQYNNATRSRKYDNRQQQLQPK